MCGVQSARIFFLGKRKVCFLLEKNKSTRALLPQTILFSDPLFLSTLTFLKREREEKPVFVFLNDQNVLREAIGPPGVHQSRENTKLNKENKKSRT